MRVRLDYSENPEKKATFLDMEYIPRVGELLVSGTQGTCEVLKVIYTPEEETQGVVLVLGCAK